MTKKIELDINNLPDVLTSAEVAALFGVDPKTVARWNKRGLLPGFRTPGGHRRFKKDVIMYHYRDCVGVIEQGETTNGLV